MKKGLFSTGVWVAVGVILLGAAALGQAAPPLINYQGRLVDGSGAPVSGDSLAMRFTFLDGDTSSATVLWGETHQAVQVTGGLYSVILGSVNPIPPSALAGSTVYLEVRVGGEVLSPRQRLTSAPFAISAANSSSLGGAPAGDYYSKAQVDSLLAAMQAQIDALSAQVAANTSDIAANSADIAVAQVDIVDHELRLISLETKLAPVTVNGSEFIFTGVNVNVRSGSGSTSGAVNGLGNLIVGYNENIGDTRTGSHNLVVGPYHSYSSYGGFLAGYNNAVTEIYATVSAGSNSTASGAYAGVSGGNNNQASGQNASVC